MKVEDVNPYRADRVPCQICVVVKTTNRCAKCLQPICCWCETHTAHGYGGCRIQTGRTA